MYLCWKISTIVFTLQIISFTTIIFWILRASPITSDFIPFNQKYRLYLGFANFCMEFISFSMLRYQLIFYYVCTCKSYNYIFKYLYVLTCIKMPITLQKYSTIFKLYWQLCRIILTSDKVTKVLYSPKTRVKYFCSIFK